MCLAAPRSSATTSAQNPCGSFRPPLSGAQAGKPAARTFSTRAAASAAATEPARKKGFMFVPSLNSGARVDTSRVNDPQAVDRTERNYTAQSPPPHGPVTHIDPVCGMEIEEADSVGTVAHGGVTYYFCAES